MSRAVDATYERIGGRPKHVRCPRIDTGRVHSMRPIINEPHSEIWILHHQRHANAEMPLDVAMKKPLPRVVGIKLDYHFIFGRNRDCCL